GIKPTWLVYKLIFSGGASVGGGEGVPLLCVLPPPEHPATTNAIAVNTAERVNLCPVKTRLLYMCHLSD
ncbi:MAG: hypothetical protein VYC51_00590, partial [Pseudomonadota bacterium]|nr:hypothetical protein [Pseudomonadota bacterium]